MSLNFSERATITQDATHQFGEKIYSGVDLLEKLKAVGGIDFASGLPCGELRGFIEACGNQSEFLHLPATNEREAVGITVGAWLAGKTPVLYMQNSGLFVSSNEIGSVLIASKIPAVFVISWRGAPGETATQHLATGSATIPLLDAFGIKFITEASGKNIDSLLQSMEETQLPVAILQIREGFNTTISYPKPPIKKRNKGEFDIEESPVSLSRDEVLEILLAKFNHKVAIFSSTGLISRSVFENFDGPNHFYNAGGFGVTSSIALGFAKSQPENRVVIIEGDGSVLTNLGNLNLIGHYQPENLLQVVLDNKALVSCSGEPTIGSNEIPNLAYQLGYRKVYSVATKKSVHQAINAVLSAETGPQMLHIRINTEGRRDFKRPLSIETIARRFREHFRE